MEEKKFLGMPKNVCLGLSWLAFPLAIVALAVDHEKMDKDDKKQFVSVFVAIGVLIIIATIVSIIGAIVAASGANIGWLFSLINAAAWVVLSLLPMIFAFINEDFHGPIAFDLAGKFVGGEEAKEEKKEE